MPKMPDRNEVATIVRQSSGIISGLMACLRRSSVSRLARADKLSYLGLSISFTDGDACAGCPFSTASRRSRRRPATAASPTAADELNVSPAAISRMVHLLEERLGVALFERKANRLAPTPAGRAYQAGPDADLRCARQPDRAGDGEAGARVLTIGVGPTFAIRWLIPRLADFQKVAPDIEVRFTTGGVAAPFADDWTCGITLGDGDWPGLVAERLFAADLMPVCAPRARAAAEAAGRPGGGDAAAGGARARRLAALAQGGRASAASQPRGRSSNITARRCRRRRRRRRRDGHPALYRRRSRGRPPGGAVRADGAEGQAVVSGLSRHARIGAGVRGVSQLDRESSAERL